MRSTGPCGPLSLIERLGVRQGLIIKLAHGLDNDRLLPSLVTNNSKTKNHSTLPRNFFGKIKTIYIHTHTRTYTYIYLRTYKYIHIHIYTYTYVCACVHTHTHKNHSKNFTINKYSENLKKGGINKRCAHRPAPLSPTDRPLKVKSPPPCTARYDHRRRAPDPRSDPAPTPLLSPFHVSYSDRPPPSLRRRRPL